MADIKYNVKTAKENNLIGKKITEICQKRHISQPKLARMLERYGVSVQPAAVGKWKSGMTTPTAYQIIAIALALNIPDIITEFTGMVCPPDLELNEQGLKKLDEYRDLLIASGKYRPRIPEAVTTATVTIPILNFIDCNCFRVN